MIIFFSSFTLDIAKAQETDYPFKIYLGFSPMRNYYGTDVSFLPEGGPERVSLAYQAGVRYGISSRWWAEMGLGYFRHKKDVFVQSLIIPEEMPNEPINISAEGKSQERYLLAHLLVQYNLLPSAKKFVPFVGLGLRSQSIAYRTATIEGIQYNYQIQASDRPWITDFYAMALAGVEMRVSSRVSSSFRINFEQVLNDTPPIIRESGEGFIIFNSGVRPYRRLTFDFSLSYAFGRRRASSR